MITFFTTLKPQRGHIATIQRNALQSWTRACPDARVLVMGDEPGAAELARELGATHVPEIARNAHGTPRLDGLFDAAERASDSRWLCYINADILLMRDFADAVRRLVRRKRRFLMVGRRWDLEVPGAIRFDDGWEAALREAVRKRARLCPPTMIDYFVYPRGLWQRIPPFAVGRTVWDNWLIYRAHQLRVPVIDATEAVTAVHQNHDYTAIGDERDAADRRRSYNRVWRGPEARTNLAMAGGKHNLYTIWDTTHQLTPAGLTLREHVGLGGGIWSYRRSARLRRSA